MKKEQLFANEFAGEIIKKFSRPFSVDKENNCIVTNMTITPDFVYDPESDSLLDFVYEVFEKKIRWHRPGVSYVCTDQGDVFMVEYMCAKHECEFFSRSTMESLKITWLKEYNFLDKLPIYNRELGMTHFFNFCGTELREV